MITTRRRKVNIIIASISVVLLIIIGICVYLYFTTDMFKSNKMLFGKYIQKAAQNVESIAKDSTGESFDSMLDSNKYTSNTEITAKYLNGIGTTAENNQNVINSLKLIIKGKTDRTNPDDKIDYKDIVLQKQDNKVTEVEYLKSGGKYGLRFTDLFGKYIAVENYSLKEIAPKIGITTDVPDKISETDLAKELAFTDVELNALNENYANILTELADNAKFSKEKNVGNIEVGNKAYIANAYTLTLSKEELNDTYVKLLEKMRDDQVLLYRIGLIDEILNPQTENTAGGETEESSTEPSEEASEETSAEPSAEASNQSASPSAATEGTGEQTGDEEQSSEEVANETFVDKYKNKIDSLITQIKNTNIGSDETTITVYESEGQTVKAEIRTPEYVLGLETAINGENDSYLRFSKDVAGIDKNTDEVVVEKSENKMYINREQRVGDEIKTTSLSNEREIVNGTKTSTINFKYDIGKSKIEVQVVNTEEIVNDFDKLDSFTNANSVTLNGLTDEEFGQIRDQLNDKGIEKLNEISGEVNIDELFSILSQLGIISEKVSLNNVFVLTMSEVSRFNAQFEIYKDQQLEVADVEKLLDIVKNNLDSIEVVSDSVIKLNIVKGSTNEQLVEKVKEIINNDENKKKQYVISCEYDEETNVIKAVNIEMKEKR